MAPRGSSYCLVATVGARDTFTVNSRVAICYECQYIAISCLPREASVLECVRPNLHLDHAINVGSQSVMIDKILPVRRSSVFDRPFIAVSQPQLQSLMLWNACRSSIVGFNIVFGQ